MGAAGILLFLSTPAAALAAGNPPASTPSVLYVSTSGSDTSGTGTSAQPYLTIQHAVDQAPTGGEVVVEPGTYKGSVNITRMVAIVADTAQSGSVVLDAAGQDNGITLTGAGASGSTILGLTIEHANNHGIFDQLASQVAIEDNTVTDNGLKPTKGIAENKPIEVVGTDGVMVVHNTVTGNQADGGIGIADDGKIDPGSPNPGQASAAAQQNLVMDNTVIGNKGGCGIVVASYNPDGVLHNRVIGNTVEKNVAGIVVAADPPGTKAVGNSVIDNTVKQNFIPGIIVHSNAPHQTVTQNVVTGNTVSQNGADSDVKQTKSQTDGIIIIGAVDPVTDTVVANNTISQQYYGVWSSNADNTTGLSSNTIDSSVKVATYSASSKAPGQSTQPAGKSYTVRPGDSLWSIAANVLGNGSLWNKIYAANRSTVGADPNFLSIGEVLTLP